MDTQAETVERATEEEIEQNLEGNDAGRAFANRHIIEKMNLFIDEYRRNGYSEDFISGFVDGINDVTGGVIYLSPGDEEEVVDEETDELLDSVTDSG